MELAQIRYFQTIAAEGSFTRAAQKLFLSQPALSKSMSRLEDELGVELFARHGVRVELNNFGRLFLSQMETVMRQISDGVKCVRDQAGLEHGTVSVALSESIELDHLFEEFLCAYPDVHFQEKYYPVEEVEAKLLDGTCDFAILSQQICSTHISWLPLFNDQICVLLPKLHPLAHRDKIYAEELSQERIAQGDRSFRTRHYVHDICERAGFQPNIIYEGGNPGMVGRLVDRGIAIALVPRSITLALSQYVPSLNENSVTVPLADPCPQRTIGIASAFGHYQSKASLQLYERVCHFYKSLSQLGYDKKL